MRTLLLLALTGCGHRTEEPVPTTPQPTTTTTNPPPVSIDHVLLLDIDGLHGSDLERYIADKPTSNLALLAGEGVRYSDVTASRPSDSFPGVLALLTGGTPASTGVFYDLSYDRSLSPPGSACAVLGSTVDYTKHADLDYTQPDGGGGLDTSVFPLDPNAGCTPVLPHQYLRVNTAFELVKSELGARTAWSDKHLSYEILQGPSGAGIDDLYDPEIGADGVEDSTASIEAYDDDKVDVVVGEIGGVDSAGNEVDPPVLLGMNFQAFSVEQKDVGYADASGALTADLSNALSHTDASIGRILAALDEAGLRESTAVVIAAPHGDAPIDPDALDLIQPAVISNLVEGVQPGLLAQMTGDDVALLWLTDPAQTPAVQTALEDEAAADGVQTVLSGDDLAALYPDAATDPRAPDLIATVVPGVIYTDSNTMGEHGGFSHDDLAVALLVANGGAPAVVDTPVETRQVAPTLLSLLGIDPSLLEAVQAEGTEPLPGL